MFSYKSVNGTNNARPKDSKKNGNFHLKKIKQKKNNKKKTKQKKNKKKQKNKKRFIPEKFFVLCNQYSVTHKVMQIQPSFE